MKIVSTASFKQRILAFLIDYLLISIFVVLIMILVFLITKFDISRYIELSAIANKYFMGKVSKEEFNIIASEYSKLTRIYDCSKYISAFVLVVIYFLYIPLKFKCQTLGRKIMKCKIIKDQDISLTVSPSRLLFREAVCNYFLYYVIGLPLIVLSAIICVLFDKSLVDMISKTRLINAIYLEIPQRDINNADDFVGSAYRDYCNNNINESIDDDIIDSDEDSDEEIILK